MVGPNSAEYIHKLIATFSNVNYSIRETAIKRLLDMGVEVIPYLLEALHHEDWRIRQQAVVTLGRIGNIELSLNPLIQSLGDKDKAVQEKAVVALGKLGSKYATEALINVLHDAPVIVQRAAAESLGELGDKRAILPLIEALQHDDSLVRSIAANSLGKLGDKNAINPLRDLLKDPHDWTRGKAAEALGMLRAAVTSDLITLLQQGDHWSPYFAAWSLGEIGDKSAIEALLKAAETTDVFLKRNCTDALRKLGYKKR